MSLSCRYKLLTKIAVKSKTRSDFCKKKKKSVHLKRSAEIFNKPGAAEKQSWAYFILQ
jgi:hypothetical protein